jgi:preprotein translocase YajC subunit
LGVDRPARGPVNYLKGHLVMQVQQLLFLAAAIVAFYFLLIRPQQQATKKQKALVESLEPGAEIMTIGGIFATIISVEDDRVLVETADDTDAAADDSDTTAADTTDADTHA